MHILKKVVRTAATALLGLSCVLGSRGSADPAGTPRVLLCRGVLSFGDALARSVRMRVDLSADTITTPECRKYPHLARFCSGSLIKIASHQFTFGGAASLENTKLWADLRRPSQLLTIEADGTDIETMRVLFLGRCAAGR